MLAREIVLHLAFILSLLARTYALHINLAHAESGTVANSTIGQVNQTASNGKVFVVVLGHGQAERSKGLSDTLHAFYQQLGPANFDCLVFVWKAGMPLPSVPPGCEIQQLPGVFMEFAALIPEHRLQAARYTYLMADDVTLNVPGHTMNIAALRDLAAANCLDMLAASHYGETYWKQLLPDRTVAWGRLMEFIEFQGNLVTPTVVHILQRLSSAGITGCWGYDSLLFTAIQKWTGRQPRLGIADKQTVNIGVKTLSAPDTAYGTVAHPCGTVTKRANGTLEHTAARQIHDHWAAKGGLSPYFWGHEKPVGYLTAPVPGRTKPQAECAPWQPPGEFVLTRLVPEFDTWLASFKSPDAMPPQ